MNRAEVDAIVAAARQEGRGADLQGADLRGTNLQEADLRGTNLQEADLRGTNLWGADLQGANLQEADLRGADLQEAKGILVVGPGGSRWDFVYAVEHEKGYMCRVGCNWFDLDGFARAVEAKYGADTEYGMYYRAVIQILRTVEKKGAKCWERVYGRLCGKPAVEVTRLGYGRCAEHTQVATLLRERLITHGPALLEAAKAALAASHDPVVERILAAAIAAVEGAR